MESLLNWFTGKKTIPRPGDILKQIIAKLETIHTSGKGHGQINASNIILDQDGRKVLSLGEEIQLNNTNTQKDDIFYLGCLFYQVITGGFHPFGQPKYVNQLKDLNLYDLSRCGSNKNLLPSDVLCNKMQQLIHKMIFYDENQRPKIREISKQHPIIWNDEAIIEYLRKAANEINSEEKWSNTLLFSDDQVKTVKNILHDISKVGW
jgi:serine/threonine protein kinase